MHLSPSVTVPNFRDLLSLTSKHSFFPNLLKQDPLSYDEQWQRYINTSSKISALFISASGVYKNLETSVKLSIAQEQLPTEFRLFPVCMSYGRAVIDFPNVGLSHGM